MVLPLLLGTAVSLELRAKQSTPVLFQESRRLMWTKFEIAAYGPDRARLAEASNAAFEEIDRLDRQMSNFSETSELTYINRNAARRAVLAEKGLFDLVKLSLDFSRNTEGAFDITVGPLMKAWGFYEGKGRTIETSELETVMTRIGYRHVKLDDRARAIRFDHEGIELDLGGIAKGYAVDVAVETLRDAGVTSALISSGTSSIRAMGAPPGESAWRVQVSHPLDRTKHLATLELRDESISTSGCAEKTVTVAGRTYCHIIDPRTGRPVEGALGATVIAPRGVEAEAWSKAAMVMGVEWTRNALKKRPDVRAIVHYRRPDGEVGSARLNF
jgi:thiamine biosynthesis lipoprotein